MGKASNPPKKQSSNFQPQKTQPSPNLFRAAAEKVSRIFSIFHRKANSKAKAALTDGSGNRNQIKGISYSTDASTESINKNLSKLKYSSSYDSFTSESGQVGSVNFSFEEIYKATEKFSPANIIGDGGFGTVYKGKLKNGSVVAIKRAKKNINDKRLSAEFKNEIRTLSQIEHLNLVRLFGYLEHGDERIIVVEYVANGTLREHLDGIRGNWLEIAERLDIAIDVAHAVTYLHTYTEPPIIHRDIKPSNILITEKFRAKVGDFGFARLAAENPDATHISTQVKGTAGYLDPEYLRTNQLTEKSDVYSFGVLLVEMVTGRRPMETKRSSKERMTVKWAMQKLKEGDAIFTMDPLIRRTPASTMAVEQVLKLARQCLASSRQSRPSMKQCAELLWGIRKDFNDKALSASSTTAAIRQSENFLAQNTKKAIRSSLGLEEDSDSDRFKSA